MHRRATPGPHFILGQACPTGACRSTQTLGLMKPRVWYFLLVVALATSSWSLPAEHGHAAVTGWASACGALYGALAVMLARASLPSLTTWSVVVTAILPAAAILFIAAPDFGPNGKGLLVFLQESSSLLPLSGAEFTLPTVAALLASFVVQRYLLRRSAACATEQ